MIIKRVKVHELTCFLLKNETEEEAQFCRELYLEVVKSCEQDASDSNIADMIAAEYVGELLMNTYLGNGVLNVTSNIQQCAIELCGMMSKIVSYLLTDHYSVLIFSNVNGKGFDCSLIQFLQEINRTDLDQLVRLGPITPSFTDMFSSFVRLYGKQIAEHQRVQSLNKVTKKQLCTWLSAIISQNPEGFLYIETLKKYLQPVKFNIKFANTLDMYKYCQTQDLNTILICKNKYIEQEFKNDEQLIFASDYGKVGIF